MGAEYITNTVSRKNWEPYARNHGAYYSCAGFYKCAADHRIHRRHQDFYLMMLCVGGEGELCCQGRRYAIRSGNLMFCHAGREISYRSSIKNPWSLYWVHFDLKKESGIQEMLYGPHLSPEHPVTACENRAELEEWYEKLLGFSDALADEVQTGLWQSYFLCLLYKGIGQFGHLKEKRNPHVEQTLEFLEQHFTEKTELETVGRAVGISKYHLSRLFRQEMGIPLGHYIEQRRIEYAKVLLASSSLSVGEIGERVGFGSGMYFSNVFRKAEGISPSAYRKRKNR
ncbi:AraC family transcriptional regulator [Cuneatibacter caecimuris]|uniref:AraC family transcriptional regulator n=1 Tax=Cuneatibacter caecimuris TaxID=1796618 RepID=A0A4Q7NYC7_9FIRM|nr:AraC family transcriptional regulator [Cuneatibacter caecimuris]RZS92423.1 AraC family transcriptional regulator [Cuneatibacter caecimuris]